MDISEDISEITKLVTEGAKKKFGWLLPNIQDDKVALRSFLHNFHWGEDLNLKAAKKNLDAGIVEIIDTETDHRSNGILITENGYFVTCYHCVKTEVPGKLIRVASGMAYPIKKVIGYNKSNDIAIAKAIMIGKHEPLRYRFAKKPTIANSFPIVHHGRYDGELRMKLGKVESPSLHSVQISKTKQQFDNQVRLDVHAVPGDSGGVVATTNGEIYGVMCTGDEDGRAGTCTFWFEVLDLISSIVK